MPPPSIDKSLNYQVRSTWLALQSLSQKIVHDSNNTYGAIQGYLSLLDLTPEKSEQIEKYLPSMQEAIDGGMALNKKLARLYRQSQPMVMNIEPVGMVRKSIDDYNSANDFSAEVYNHEAMAPLPLEEDQFRQLVSHLCHLLQATETDQPTLSVSRITLQADQISTMVMEGKAGDYLCLTVSVDREKLDGDGIQFLQPFKMPVPGTDALGMADILVIISSHFGNLDLDRSGNLLLVSSYFPYPFQ